MELREESWQDRCTAVLDELVAGRVRRNSLAMADLENDQPNLEFVPSQRDVRQAMLDRWGKAASFRELGPWVTDYLTRNNVFEKLPVSPRGRTRTQQEDTAVTAPQRVMAAIDQHLGALNASRRKL